MLVKNIEQKIKINKVVSIASILFAVLIVIVGFVFAYKLVQDSRKSLYVIDNGVPILVKQTDELLNRPVEYKSQIELFHRLFFTLAPDDRYIKENVEKSLYLIDDSGKKEYTNLREKRFLQSDNLGKLSCYSTQRFDKNGFTQQKIHLLRHSNDQ